MTINLIFKCKFIKCGYDPQLLDEVFVFCRRTYENPILNNVETHDTNAHCSTRAHRSGKCIPFFYSVAQEQTLQRKGAAKVKTTENVAQSRERFTVNTTCCSWEEDLLPKIGVLFKAT